MLYKGRTYAKSTQANPFLDTTNPQHSLYLISRPVLPGCIREGKRILGHSARLSHPQHTGLYPADFADPGMALGVDWGSCVYWVRSFVPGVFVGKI